MKEGAMEATKGAVESSFQLHCQFLGSIREFEGTWGV